MGSSSSARRVALVLLVCAAVLAGHVQSVEFFQPDNSSYDMVVGNPVVIYWTEYYGQSYINLALLAPGNETAGSLNSTSSLNGTANFNATDGFNTTGGFDAVDGVNETICVGADIICQNSNKPICREQSCRFWPPPTLVTGVYVLRVNDTLGYSFSPEFTITNYDNVTATEAPWLETTTAAATPYPTPTDTSDDDDDDDSEDPDPHNLELWLPVTLGPTFALSLIAFIIYNAKKQERAAKKGKMTAGTYWVELGDADARAAEAASHEHHGLLGIEKTGKAKQKSLFGLMPFLFRKRGVTEKKDVGVVPSIERSDTAENSSGGRGLRFWESRPNRLGDGAMEDLETAAMAAEHQNEPESPTEDSPPPYPGAGTNSRADPGQTREKGSAS